jgi:N-acetyl-anhydromuramyl-L-alanine amidase AmpD
MESWLPEYCYNPERPHTTEAVVIHFISCVNVQPSNPFDPQSNWWLLHDLNCEPKARMMFNMPELPTRAYASYHSIIDREGVVRLLVPVDKYAYHAGVSEFKGRKNWNDFAYGVALLGHGKSKFTDAQYSSLAKLCASLMSEYKFSDDWIAGHEEIAPGRKVDPGIASGNFDMPRLKKMIGDINA